MSAIHRGGTWSISRRSLSTVYHLAIAYWFLRRFLYWFVADVYYAMFQPLATVAVGWREMVSVSLFVARWATVHHRLIPRRYLRRLRGDAVLTLHGGHYVVDLESDEVTIFRELYQQHLYERHDDFIPNPGATVVDVGANAGLFTIQQALHGACVYAFEPNPDCYRRLTRAIHLNGLADRVALTQTAVGAAPGCGVLTVPQGFTCVGTVAPATGHGHVLGTDSRVVPMTSLDAALPHLGVQHVDLLKIDAEGAEGEILRGATHILSCVDRIMLEYHSFALLSEVLARLQAHGFEEVLRVGPLAGPEYGLLYAARHALGQTQPNAQPAARLLKHPALAGIAR